MMHIGRKPKGKHPTIVFQTINVKKSAVTPLHRSFNVPLWQSKMEEATDSFYFMAAGRSSLTRPHLSPNITTVILTITVSFSAAQSLYQTCTKINLNLMLYRRKYAHKSAGSLSDLAKSTETFLLNVPVTSLPSSKGSFATLSKASLMPPITGGGGCKQADLEWGGLAGEFATHPSLLTE